MNKNDPNTNSNRNSKNSPSTPLSESVSAKRDIEIVMEKKRSIKMTVSNNIKSYLNDILFPYLFLGRTDDPFVDYVW